MNFVAKMTNKINANDFVINFYDADGVKVIPENLVVLSKGACYRKDFGEWRCMPADFNGYATIEENVPHTVSNNRFPPLQQIAIAEIAAIRPFPRPSLRKLQKPSFPVARLECLRMR